MVLFDQFLNNIQPQPRPLFTGGLGGEERCEQFVLILPFDPHAVIFHVGIQEFFAIILSADRDVGAVALFFEFGLPLHHRVIGIVDQIDALQYWLKTLPGAE